MRFESAWKKLFPIFVAVDQFHDYKLEISLKFLVQSSIQFNTICIPQNSRDNYKEL